jgi:probable rRNA maturation factor
LAGGSHWILLFSLHSKRGASAVKECEKKLVIFRRRVAQLKEVALSRFVSKASRASGVKGTVDVLVTTSRELRLLNNRFLGKDEPTDVLSFPSELGSAKHCAGEIAISAEIASENARLLGHSLAEEIKILALHGLLHLAGYDHERDKGEMARKELRLRTKLNLPSGLIERSPEAGSAGKRPGRPRGKRSRATTARQLR